MQMEAHQAECVKATEGVLIDLVAKHDAETLKLLEEAAAQEKGELWYAVPAIRMLIVRYMSVHSRTRDLKICFSFQQVPEDLLLQP